MMSEQSRCRADREPSRRGFIRDVAACAVTPWLLNARDERGQTTTREIEAMEGALERLAGLALLTNHGPMAAEAMVALGRADQVAAWVDGYCRRFTNPYPSPHSTITRTDWRAALGDTRREADWVEYFSRELREAAWRSVVGRWAAELAPGLAAAAAHGLIRTAHAVRTLESKETMLRLRELAAGLGYWAAYYQPLPERPSAVLGGKSAGLTPAEALGVIPHLPEEKRMRGNIINGLRSLDRLPEFASVADLTSTTTEASSFISEMTETFAGVYARHAQSSNAIALVHAVTGATALRTLLPYLSPVATRRALRYGWQLSAAIYAVYVEGPGKPLPAAVDLKRDELIDRAIATEDEHSIKFTEACLREYALNPKPIYLLAACDAVGRFT